MDNQKKKRELSTLQKLTNSQKRIESYKSKTLPTVKEAMHIRTITLAMQYLERQTDINKEIITFSNYCKKNKISENTLRKALKELTGETHKNNNPSSNNIQKYQKEKKAILNKVALIGIESLTDEELITFEKIKESENKRLSKIRENNNKDISQLTKSIANITLNNKNTDQNKPTPSSTTIRKRQGNLKGGTNVTKEEELSSEDYSINEDEINKVTTFLH